MKTFLSLILLYFCCAGIANAQKEEKAIAQVKYRLIHVRDTNDRQRPYTEELVLLIGKNASAYSSMDAQRQEKLRSKELQDQIKKSANPNSLDLVLTGSSPVTYSEYFQFLSTRKLFIRYKLNNNYLTEERLPQLNWKMSNETMNIDGLDCQKASTRFKGRDYIAWFCPDLPIQTGPWELNGLPGLIIQVSDIKKEVIFQFISFEDISNKKLMIKLPVDVVKASKADVNRLIELQQKNPAAYAKLPSGKISGAFGDVDPSRINSIRINSPSVNFGKVINNPIELPETK